MMLSQSQHLGQWTPSVLTAKVLHISRPLVMSHRTYCEDVMCSEKADEFLDLLVNNYQPLKDDPEL
jgi:hypothetical protein